MADSRADSRADRMTDVVIAGIGQTEVGEHWDVNSARAGFRSMGSRLPGCWWAPAPGVVCGEYACPAALQPGSPGRIDCRFCRCERDRSHDPRISRGFRRGCLAGRFPGGRFRAGGYGDGAGGGKIYGRGRRGGRRSPVNFPGQRLRIRAWDDAHRSGCHADAPLYPDVCSPAPGVRRIPDHRPRQRSEQLEGDVPPGDQG